jgi:hypothetical protein
LGEKNGPHQPSELPPIYRLLNGISAMDTTEFVEGTSANPFTEIDTLLTSMIGRCGGIYKYNGQSFILEREKWYAEKYGV